MTRRLAQTAGWFALAAAAWLFLDAAARGPTEGPPPESLSATGWLLVAALLFNPWRAARILPAAAGAAAALLAGGAALMAATALGAAGDWLLILTLGAGAALGAGLLRLAGARRTIDYVGAGLTHVLITQHIAWLQLGDSAPLLLKNAPAALLAATIWIAAALAVAVETRRRHARPPE